jgi:hypothetical protein
VLDLKALELLSIDFSQWPGRGIAFRWDDERAWEVHTMADTTIERKLVELERRYWQALKDKDVAAAIELTDEPCIVAGAQGVGSLDHATYRAMMENATWTIVDFDIRDDVQVRLLGDESAILAYTVHEELKVDGEPVAFDAADTSTWVRRNGRWLCALHTESIAGDPFGRNRS